MTVTELINDVAGAELQAPVKQAIAENNSVLRGCGVHTLFRQSCVDLETGRHGLRWLIARILSERGAVLPRYAGAYRAAYVGAAMFTDEIIAKVREFNGFDKYPDKTIRQNLFVVMKRAGQVASIRLTNREDSTRTSKRPRLKWYYVAE